MTWYQLLKRMDKQPLNLTKNKKVAVKIQDKMYECKIVYTYNGSDWHLEPIREIKKEEKKNN